MNKYLIWFAFYCRSMDGSGRYDNCVELTIYADDMSAAMKFARQYAHEKRLEYNEINIYKMEG